ncbi:MAG TPA: hypothetical protein ENK63_05635 [Rhodobacterales bacterium]|nr:hypothetical protein [Rhodobacterales bacterium]
MTFFKSAVLAASLLAAGPTLAQTAGMDHVLHSQLGGHMEMAPVSQPGQGAFAAIGEIVATLEADPATDWSTVDIDALRDHLVDMDLVTTRSTAQSTPIEGGLRFTVHGSGDVTGAVQRMVLAHAAIMDGVGDWHFAAQQIDDGAILDVTVPEADRARLAGLGFYGVMASGMHHQAHHWAMATGSNPHH